MPNITWLQNGKIEWNNKTFIQVGTLDKLDEKIKIIATENMAGIANILAHIEHKTLFNEDNKEIDFTGYLMITIEPDGCFVGILRELLSS